MAITIRQQENSTVDTPSVGRVSYFTDTTGTLKAKDSAGVITTFGRFVVNWKNGTSGNPYVDTDTVNAAVDEMIMVDSAVGDTVTIQFPASDAASAGRQILIQNINDIKSFNYGTVVFTPASGDKMGVHTVDQATVLNSNQRGMVLFAADGAGTWWPQVEEQDPMIDFP